MPELEETAEKSQESFTPITALHQKKSSSGSKEDRIAILQTFLKYYGIDWAAMVFMFSSIYALGLKNRMGFFWGGAGCVCWIAFGILVGSVADITANIITLGMNIVGFVRWSK